jgi:hypothetical protein
MAGKGGIARGGGRHDDVVVVGVIVDHGSRQPGPMRRGLALEPGEMPVEKRAAGGVDDERAMPADGLEPTVEVPDERPAGPGMIEAPQASREPSRGPPNVPQEPGRMGSYGGQRFAIDVGDEPDEVALPPVGHEVRDEPALQTGKHLGCKPLFGLREPSHGLVLHLERVPLLVRIGDLEDEA